MKKRILAISLAVLLVAVAGYGTLAYFTASDGAKNTITTGKLNMSLKEYQDTVDENGLQNEDENGITIKVDNLVPGDTVSKIPVLTLNSSINTAVRVIITIKCEKPGGGNLPVDPIVIQSNGDDGWNDDGNWSSTDSIASDVLTRTYYFFLAENNDKSLQTIKHTFFDTVKFDAEKMDNDYQGATITITLKADAIQADNIGADTDGNVGLSKDEIAAIPETMWAK